MKKLLLILLCLPLLFSCGDDNCVSGDCENGQGTMIFSSGNKYVGEFKDGWYDGQGTFTWASGEWEGDKYVGEYKDGFWHGQGTYTWAKGDKYVGEHKDGKKEGQGTMTYADGTIEKGLWEDDEFLGE
jgi:hypothetical protein